jgi:hypothetical protein
MAEQVAALLARRAQAQAELDHVKEGGETQLSCTDADARLLTRAARRSRATTYRFAVDDTHKLIVASGAQAGCRRHAAYSLRGASAGVRRMSVAGGGGECKPAGKQA